MKHVAEERAQLRSYYEREAELATRTDSHGERQDLRSKTIALLIAEGRGSVVDFGCGPGFDGRAFQTAGLRVVGVDLAVGNAKLGAANGLVIIAASIGALPFRSATFDAGWSMSTLMHLPDDAALSAASAMGSCLTSGAPLVIGLWGGSTHHIDHSTIEGERRPFHLRSADQNRRIIEAAGPIESTARWDAGPVGWEYQVFRVRVR